MMNKYVYTILIFVFFSLNLDICLAQKTAANDEKTSVLLTLGKKNPESLNIHEKLILEAYLLNEQQVKLINDGRKLYFEGKYQDAADKYATVIQQVPGYLSTISWYGHLRECYRQMGDIKKMDEVTRAGIKAGEEIIEKEKDSLWLCGVYQYLIRHYSGLSDITDEDIKKSEKIFSIIISYPDDFVYAMAQMKMESMIKMGDIYEKKNMYEKSLAQFQQVINYNLRKEDQKFYFWKDEALFGKANVLVSLGKNNDAGIIYNDLIERYINREDFKSKFPDKDWEIRSEMGSRLEYYASKKYKEFKVSIKNNVENIYNDPFGESRLRFSNKTNSFYSIGPDRVDQFLEIIYDPTNGVFSAGDIEVKKTNR